MSTERSKIGIVYTGGTIGGTGEEVINDKLDEVSFMQVLGEKDVLPQSCDIVYRCPLNKFSECMLPSDWLLIAESVAEIASGVDGVVVLHGTDTLCYTASALAFMLGNTVPVMVTGANIPLSIDGSDAPGNIQDCITAIMSKEFKGVCVCFAGDVHIALRTRKVAIEGNSYSSIGCQTLGKISGRAVMTNVAINEQYWDCCNKDNQFGMAINPNVGLYKMYPGFKASIIANDENDAIVLELYNNGTGPYGLDEIYSLEKNIAKYGKPVFVTSQQSGSVSMDTYGSSFEIAGAGAVGLGSMLTETAIVKLMWLLGCGLEKDDLKKAMLTNVRGELICNNLL